MIDLARRGLKILASLQLTVVLLVLAIVLVFCGTLAQVDEGLWTVLAGYFRSLFVMIPFKIFFPRSWQVPGAFPFPGGTLIGIVLLANLLAAHAVRFKLSWARSGILLVHAGLVVLLLSEFVTGKFSVEGNMSIDVGGSSNYLEDNRRMELAVVNPADPAEDEVTAIPESLLRAKAPIRHDSLPFEIQPEACYVNSTITPAGNAPGSNPATRGDGLKLLAVRAPEVSGASSEQTRDLGSAYVTLLEKGSGRKLGTWLVALTLDPQEVSVDGQKRTIALRPRRTYKPYRLDLKEFRHDLYAGTKIPKNFSSRVRLVDAAQGVDREVLISMNNPLRYRGETFFQASFKPGDGGTILQVVRNPGWLMPYVSCVLVAIGLVVQFLISLVRHLRKTREAGGKAPRSWIPAAAAAAAAAWLAVAAIPPSDRDDAMHVLEFARLPAVHGGRVKPLDSLARNSLMTVSGRQSWTDAGGATQPAIGWLLDVLSGANRTATVFRIEHDQVLATLGLSARPGFRYAIHEFADKIEALEALASRAHEKRAGERDLYEQKVIELFDKLLLYMDLSRMKSVLLVPPQAGGEWRSLPDAARAPDAETNPVLASYVMMLKAYAAGNEVTFNRELATYRAALETGRPADARTAGFEFFLNSFAPFFHCAIIYVLIFLLVIASFLGVGGPLRSAAFSAAALTFAVHLAALVARMLIQDRPWVFVTNLYSSAVFIGWFGAGLGLVLERFNRQGIGTLLASAIGAVTLVIAHSLAARGDTLEVMQAVLDTNFWLATHVTCVTIGYASTYIAGLLGIVHVVRRLGGREIDPSIAKMTYGIVCFATLFSFVGTVLGGIWADQSWGRFWGWDPKENGALIIVLWNALILHARWGGMVKARGIAVLAVVGNIVTSWSWFGVNMLGVGLHSYGFMGSAVFWLAAFVVSQLIVVGLGLLPLRGSAPDQSALIQPSAAGSEGQRST